MPKTHRILIVGVGSIGERHLRCFQATGRAEVAFCESNDELRHRIAERYKVAQALADFKAALESGHDAVVICTPAPLHIPMALRAAEAGLHMLIEKPLSTGLEGVQTLQQRSAERGLVAAVAYVYRAHPALTAMRQAILEGRFGRPVQVVATCGQHFPTFRPAYRDIYYKDRATGGGAIQDALTHILNAAEWLVGPVDRLVCDADHKILEGVEVEDTVHLLARHADVMASYSLNQHQAPNELTITVLCTGGTLRFESHNQQWRWMAHPQDPWHDEPMTGPLERDTLFIRQAHAFLDAVEGAARPLCSLEQGAQTLRCNLAALKSIEESAWQTVNPASVSPRLSSCST